LLEILYQVQNPGQIHLDFGPIRPGPFDTENLNQRKPFGLIFYEFIAFNASIAREFSTKGIDRTLKSALVRVFLVDRVLSRSTRFRSCSVLPHPNGMSKRNEIRCEALDDFDGIHTPRTPKPKEDHVI
jgi:hypothetical protein